MILPIACSAARVGHERIAVRREQGGSHRCVCFRQRDFRQPRRREELTHRGKLGDLQRCSQDREPLQPGANVRDPFAAPPTFGLHKAPHGRDAGMFGMQPFDVVARLECAHAAAPALVAARSATRSRTRANSSTESACAFIPAWASNPGAVPSHESRVTNHVPYPGGHVNFRPPSRWTCR